MSTDKNNPFGIDMDAYLKQVQNMMSPEMMQQMMQNSMNMQKQFIDNKEEFIDNLFGDTELAEFIYSNQTNLSPKQLHAITLGANLCVLNGHNLNTLHTGRDKEEIIEGL